ncbi:MAG TPA: nuclear transport factor 2 family protein [Acidimicrobiales bacterium]|nr:nuclear transport factor 2 family protein [Acidimicrobiales bacterium]
MDPIERLEAIEEIRQLKARYFRCLDAKDWEGFGDVFTDDAQLDVSEDAADLADAIVGREAIIELVARAVGEAVTIHHGHMPEITVESSDAASGIWAMEDHLFWPEGGPVRSMHGYGHYRERYRRTDAGWRIERMVLTRLRVDLDRPPRDG